MASQDKGNFAGSRNRAAEAGQKGGQASQDSALQQGDQSGNKSGQQTGEIPPTPLTARQRRDARINRIREATEASLMNPD